MTLEVILCQSFSKCVSNLVLCVDSKDLDKSLTHMFVKMMVANIYVLGPWSWQQWAPRASQEALQPAPMPPLDRGSHPKQADIIFEGLRGSVALKRSDVVVTHRRWNKGAC